MLVSPKVLLTDAAKHGYAVAAFNFYNLDTLTAVVRAAEQEQAPVIAQIYSSHYIHYDGGDPMAAAALDLIRRSTMPIALHLDHSSSFDYILQAMRSGFNSVMYDGSALPLEQNIANTAKVTEIARSLGLFTEAELGRIARVGSGEEDAVDYTTVEDAVKLVESTGVDSLAPAIGTVHGMYRREPDIRFDLLRDIRAAVPVPLVLHGGSGIPDNMILDSIACGIRKINVGTELKYTWSTTVHDAVSRGEKEIIALSRLACDAVQEVACRKIRLFGGAGRGRDILESLIGRCG